MKNQSGTRSNSSNVGITLIWSNAVSKPVSYSFELPGLTKERRQGFSLAAFGTGRHRDKIGVLIDRFLTRDFVREHVAE